MEAERLLIERARQRLSIQELAERSGVNAHTISEMERGVRNPRATTVAKIAEALGLAPEELLGKAPASHPSAEGSLEQRRFKEPAETSEPRHSTVNELVGKIQDMKLVERRRRRDIDSWGSEELGLTRVWEWQAFDEFLRDEYGAFADAVNARGELESPEMQRRCLEFSGQLATLENLTAQARTVADAVDADISVGTEKAAHGLQHLQGNHEVEQEVER